MHAFLAEEQCGAPGNGIVVAAKHAMHHPMCRSNWSSMQTFMRRAKSMCKQGVSESEGRAAVKGSHGQQNDVAPPQLC